MKTVNTPTYKYIFNDKTGLFMRWGKTEEDDPQYSPIGNEILDIEVSTICHQGCKFCYKSNVSKGKNMSFDTFKKIIDKMPTLTQIAFGIGSIDANPDLFRMMEYCREVGIVPNITINGSRMTPEYYGQLVKYCGAVAVSNYGKDMCYGAVEQLTNIGLEQVNIHQLLANETFDQCINLIDDIQYDSRLKNLYAVVFLSLKQKGRGTSFTRVDDNKFIQLIDKCLESNIRFGFDSCTACKFIGYLSNKPKCAELIKMAEPCESGLFSYYVDVDGIGSPCSFASGFGYETNILEVEDFLQDIWFGSLAGWRKKLLANNRNCPLYTI